MYCENCGKFMPDNARFCGNCGKTFEGDKVNYNKTKSLSIQKICIMILIVVLCVCVFIILAAQKRNFPTKSTVLENSKATVMEEQETLKETIVSYEKLNNFNISTVYLDMNDYIHENDIFWIKGKDTLDNNWYFAGIDLNFNVYYKVKCIKTANEIEQPIGTGYYLLCYDFSNGNYSLIDMEGKPAEIFCRNANEKLYWASNDSTGGTIWTTESVDTYNSHDTIIRAYDLNGNLRAEWSSVNLNEKYNMQWDGVFKEGKYKGLGRDKTVIEYVGDEIYYMNAGDYIIILNVTTGSDFGRKDEADDIVVELVGEDIYLCHSYGGVASSTNNEDMKVSIYDKQGNLNFYGNVGTPYNIYVNTLRYDRYIGYGIFTSVNKSDSWSSSIIYMNYKSGVI